MSTSFGFARAATWLRHGTGGRTVRRRWIVVALLGPVVLSGCSPYVHDQEIEQFSNGVNAVVSSYQTGRRAVDTIVAERQRTGDAAARRPLLLLPGCDQMDAGGVPPTLPACAVAASGATAAPTPVQKHLADAAPAFNALKAYAGALTAVTTAADETALNQATQGLTSAESGLIGAVAEVAPAAAAANSGITALGNVMGRSIALYLDQRRYAALRSTVPAMDHFVQALGRTVEAALSSIRAQQLLALGSVLRGDAERFAPAAVGRLDVGDYQSGRVTLETEVAAFDQARAADPAASVTAMIEAHHQLALALQANAGQGTAVASAVATFELAAEKLEVAVAAGSRATAEPPAASGGRSSQPDLF